LVRNRHDDTGREKGLKYLIVPGHKEGCLCLSALALQEELAIYPLVMLIESVISSSMSLEPVLRR
jgi:hypothetical protein